MSFFRKRPVIVEAFRFGFDAQPAWFRGQFNSMSVVIRPNYNGPGQEIADIRTLEGWMRANRGDWIVKGVRGELYPVKPDIFAETYEACDAKNPRTETERLEWLFKHYFIGVGDQHVKGPSDIDRLMDQDGAI